MTTKRRHDWMADKTDNFILFHQFERLNLLEDMYVWERERTVSSSLLYPHLLNNNRAHKPKPNPMPFIYAMLKRWILGWAACWNVPSTFLPKLAIVPLYRASHTFNNHKYNGNDKFEYIYDRFLWTYERGTRECVSLCVGCVISLSKTVMKKS